MTFYPNGHTRIKCGECGKIIGSIERNKLTAVVLAAMPVWCVECVRRDTPLAQQTCNESKWLEESDATIHRMAQ